MAVKEIRVTPGCVYACSSVVFSHRYYRFIF